MLSTVIMWIVGLQLGVTALAFLVGRFLVRKQTLENPRDRRSLQLELLGSELERTESGLHTHPPPSDSVRTLLEKRRAYLSAELNALKATRHVAHFWENLAAQLEVPHEAITPTGDDTPGEAAPAEVAQAETGDRTDEEKQMLRELVETYEGRVNSLEMFRDQFFELKEKLEAVQESYQKLQEELDQVLPKSERSEELERLNELLNDENAKLEKKLAQLSEDAGDSTTVGRRKRRDVKDLDALARSQLIEKEVEEIASHVTDQENILSSLKQQAKDSSGDQEELMQLVKNITDLERRLQDIRGRASTLEEENRGLKSELQDAIGSAQTKDSALEEYRDTVDDLKGLVVDQKERIRQLYDEITSLSSKAEEADSMKTLVQDFTQKNSEMLMCIYTLEDENEFLHNQIAELLKIEKGAPLEEIGKATENAVSQGEVQKQIEGLEQELREKDEAYTALQKKFASIEKEYLVLFEQLHGKKK